MKKKVLMKGNEAAAEAAVRAGCRFYAGYPITPQNEIPEYLSVRLPEAGGTFIQAESELAAVNMVYGASAAGARAMTSSSSPGISLKQEGISFLAGAELPAVIINMQRGGPGLGNISGSQADYFQAVKGGGHGDYKLLVYAPASVQELWDWTMLAFEKADEYRNPVMILGDGFLSQVMEPIEMTEPKNTTPLPKPWALTGAKGREPNVIKTLYVDDGALEQVNMRILKKYELMREKEVMFDSSMPDGSDTAVVAFGTAARLARSAIETLNQEGRNLGLFRPITLFPFPEKPLSELADTVKKIIVFELNAGQMVEDVRLAVNGKAPVLFHGRPGGPIVTPEELTEEIRKLI